MTVSAAASSVRRRDSRGKGVRGSGFITSFGTGHSRRARVAAVAANALFVACYCPPPTPFLSADVNSTPEARRFYWMVTLRATAAFAAAAAKAGGAIAPAAAHFAAAVTDATARLRAAGGATWYAVGGYGLHSMAAAILGGWTTDAERVGSFGLFNDSAHICSLSNYDRCGGVGGGGAQYSRRRERECVWI